MDPTIELVSYIKDCVNVLCIRRMVASLFNIAVVVLLLLSYTVLFFFLIRIYSYGQPSKRLTQIMGPPLTPDEVKVVPTMVQQTTNNNGFVAGAGGGSSSGGASSSSSSSSGGNHPPLQQAYPGYPY